MKSFQDDPQHDWRHYYALRNWARLSLLAIPVVLYLLFVHTPEALVEKLNDLPFPLRIGIVFVLIGVATIGFAAPVLRWAKWKCPRCGEKFVQPKVQFGAIGLLMLVAWRLIFGWRCARCKLPCGADPSEFYPNR